MKAYVFKKFSRVMRILADEHDGYLTWPNTKIPYLDQDLLTLHSDKERIEQLLNEAETSEPACDLLWKDPAVMEMVLKAENSEI